jgi:hypothetical protein
MKERGERRDKREGVCVRVSEREREYLRLPNIGMAVGIVESFMVPYESIT